MAPKKLSAKAVLEDIRGGLSDEELTSKYLLSSKGLHSLFGKLIKAGFLTQEELDNRVLLFGDMIELDEASLGIPGPAAVPPSPRPTAHESDPKLAKLKAAFEAGILTEAEYEEKRSALSGKSSKITKLEQAYQSGILSQAEFEKKKSNLTGQPIPRAVNKPDRSKKEHKYQVDFDPRPGEEALDSFNVTLTRWLFVLLNSNMTITNQRILFKATIHWLAAIQSAGLSLFITKFRNRTIDLPLSGIKDVRERRSMFIFPGFLIRMKSGKKYKFLNWRRTGEFIDLIRANMDSGDLVSQEKIDRPRSTGETNDGRMRFQDPSNNHIEELSNPWLWTLLFGPFYFMAKGVWKHAVIGIFLAVFTSLISWFVYPFYAKKIMREYYLKKGWTQLI